MKKIVIVSIVVVLTIAIAGAFSVNYIFDKMIGNQILSQLDLESLPDGFIDSIIGSILDNETEDVKDTDKEASEKSNSNEDKKGGSNLSQDSVKNNEFSKEQLMKIQDQFSTMDKLKVMRMLSSKLSTDEIKTLMSITSGGVSDEELNDLKEVLKQKLTQDDIELLKELYSKYDQ